MPRLILHIGTHKTATTSIQRFLQHNQTALAARGVFYPDYTLVGRGAHYAHIGMVNALSGRHKSYSRELAHRFFAMVRDRVGDYDTTIISAEPFYRHVANMPTDNPYYTPEAYWPLRHAYIQQIGDIFGAAEVVVVFRRQLDYAQSLYQEHVKVTSYRGTFRQFCKDFWFHFAFGDQAAAWNAVFPKTTAMRFEDLTASPDTVRMFCQQLGIDTDGLEDLPRSNEGLPVDIVVLKRMLHRVTENREDLRMQLETLTAQMPPDVHSLFKTRSFFTSAKDARSFQHKFTATNNRLRPFLTGQIARDTPVFGTYLKPGLDFGDRIKPPVLQAMLSMSLANSA
jgi:hypothetical protein